MNIFNFKKETKIAPNGEILHRVIAHRDIRNGTIKKGDKGGWIGKNAKFFDDAWIADGAMVYGNARMFGNSLIDRNASLYDNAKISGYAYVSDGASVHGNSIVTDNCRIYGNAEIFQFAHILGSVRIYGNAKVYGTARVYGNSIIHGGDNVNKLEGIINIIITGGHSITITSKYVYIDNIQFERKYLTENQLKIALNKVKKAFKIYKNLIDNAILLVK